jgi:hypothetical protein
VPTRGSIRAAVAVCAALLLGALGACGRGFEGGGELRAQKKVLEREVGALRDAVARLERREPLIPTGDLAVGIDEALLRGVITAQLPFEASVGDYQLRLDQADVLFRGAPTVKLRGRLKRLGKVELEAVVNVVGALDRIAVDEARSALAASIVVDHIGIEKAAGVEALLSGSAVDELARMIRLRLADKLPQVQIPVKLQQSIELPAVTTGPVRIDGARIPIAASVSRVLAGQGRLWVGIHFQPGELTKTADAPEAEDAKAQDVETGFEPGPDEPVEKAKRQGGRP